MHFKKMSPTYIIYCMMVVLTIYKDSPLSLVLGAAGYTVVMPLSIILFFFVAISVQHGKIKRYQETEGLFRLGTWLLIVSIVAIAIWIILGKPIKILGEYIPIKALKVWLQYLSYPMYIYILTFCIKKMKSVQQIFAPIFISLIILAIIDVIELTQIPYAFEGVHFAGSFPYWRVRLFTPESGWTSLLIYVYAALSLYYGWAYKKKTVFILSAISTIIPIVGTTSKALLSSIAISAVIYVVITGKISSKKTIKRLLFVSIAGILFAYYLLPRLVTSLRGDILNYTSVATRLYTSIIGLGIGVVIPSGVGCGIHLGVFQWALGRFLPMFQGLPIMFNTREILLIMSAKTDKVVGVKSGILQFNMYWGIIGTFWLFRIFREASKRVKESFVIHNEMLRTIFWGAVFQLFLLNLDFEFWLLFAVVHGVSSIIEKGELNKAVTQS